MEREQLRNKIIQFLKEQIPLLNDPSRNIQLQLGSIEHYLQPYFRELPSWQYQKILSTAKEIFQEFINNGLLLIGNPTNFSEGYPWFTITEYGKKCFMEENLLPYDPDGYITALRSEVPNLDDITLNYISEAIAAYNRRHLLSATLTLGVASENLMLQLIEKYIQSIKNGKIRERAADEMSDKSIFRKYKEFRNLVDPEIKTLPQELKDNFDTYLEGIFNFVRLNRNGAGHPTGKKLESKIIYANLQIFSDYAKFIYKLTNFFENS